MGTPRLADDRPIADVVRRDYPGYMPEPVIYPIGHPVFGPRSARCGGSAPARVQVRAGDFDRGGDGTAQRVGIVELRATQSRADPPGQERAAECVAGTHRVDDLDRTDRDGDLAGPGERGDGFPAAVSSTTAGPPCAARPSSARAASAAGSPGRRNARSSWLTLTTSARRRTRSMRAR